MNQSHAESILRDYYQELRDIVLDGFGEYAQDYAHVSYKHHARTRATTIHDHIFALAKERLSKHSAFHQIPTTIRNLFDVAGILVIQFKKLNRNLRTSNILTQLTLAFNNQREVHLPGIPPTLPRLALGYVPKRDWTEVDGVYLTYSVGRTLLWYIDITQAGEQTAAFPQNLPITPTPTDAHAAPERRKVRAKHPKRKPGGISATGV